MKELESEERADGAIKAARCGVVFENKVPPQDLDSAFDHWLCDRIRKRFPESFLQIASHSFDKACLRRHNPFPFSFRLLQNGYARKPFTERLRIRRTRLKTMFENKLTPRFLAIEPFLIEGSARGLLFPYNFHAFIIRARSGERLGSLGENQV